MDSESVRLRDGRTVELRHADAGDAELFRDYLTKLGDLNYGGKEPTDPKKEGSSVVWIGEHSASAQLSADELKLTLPRF